MPKSMHPDLRDCLRRANPYVYKHVELSIPDVSRVLRRTDHWVENAVDGLSSDFAHSIHGGLELAAEPGTLAEFAGVQSHFDLNIENESRRLKGLLWEFKPEFSQARIRTFTAKIKRVGAIIPEIDFELQIFGFSRIPGEMQSGMSQQYSTTPVIRYVPRPMLSPPAIVKATEISWPGGQGILPFQLQQHGLSVQGFEGPDAHRPGDLPLYLFSIRPLKLQPSLTGVFQWSTDTLTAHDVAEVGSFKRVFWARENDDEEWVRNDYADTPNFKLEVDSFPMLAQQVFEITLPQLPAANSIGRWVLESRRPPGTAVVYEASFAGPTGPWEVVRHGDEISQRQQTAHLRITMASNST